jgi:hypothetical protein
MFLRRIGENILIACEKSFYHKNGGQFSWNFFIHFAKLYVSKFINFKFCKRPNGETANMKVMCLEKL